MIMLDGSRSTWWYQLSEKYFNIQLTVPTCPCAIFVCLAHKKITTGRRFNWNAEIAFAVRKISYTSSINPLSWSIFFKNKVRKYFETLLKGSKLYNLFLTRTMFSHIRLRREFLPSVSLQFLLNGLQSLPFCFW